MTPAVCVVCCTLCTRAVPANSISPAQRSLKLIISPMTDYDSNAVFGTTFNILRSRSAETPEVALGNLQQRLQEEFNRIGSSGCVVEASLQAALCHLRQAIAYVQHHKIDLAREKFVEVDRKAVEAFFVATSFEGKVLATRFRLVCTVFLSGYYAEETVSAVINDQCLLVFEDFLQLSDVRAAIAYEFEPALRGFIKMGEQRCKEVMRAVGDIRNILAETVAAPSYPILSSAGEAVNVSENTAASLLGHRYRVQSLVLSQEWLFSAGWDGVSVWHSRTLQKVAVGDGGERDRMHCLAVCGDRLYGGSKDGSVIVWDASPLALTSSRIAEMARVRKHTRNVRSLAASSGRLYSGSEDTHIRVWDLTGAGPAPIEVGAMQGHRGGVCSLTLGEGRLYSGGDDNLIVVWDTLTLNRVLQLHGHEGGVRCLALDVRGCRLFSGSEDKTIRVWDTETLKERGTLGGSSNAAVNCLAVSDNGLLYSGGGGWMVRVWDITTALVREVSCFYGHRGGVSALAVASEAGQLFSGSWDKTIRMRRTSLQQQDLRREGTDSDSEEGVVLNIVESESSDICYVETTDDDDKHVRNEES